MGEMSSTFAILGPAGVPLMKGPKVSSPSVVSHLFVISVSTSESNDVGQAEVLTVPSSLGQG